MARPTVRSRLRARLQAELDGQRARLQAELDGQRAAFQAGPGRIVTYRNEGAAPDPDTDAGFRWAMGHSPEGWPEGLPLPLTAADALAAFERSIDAMADQIAADIQHAAELLVRPELLARALRWDGLAERWPIAAPFSVAEMERRWPPTAAGWVARRNLGGVTVAPPVAHKERPGIDTNARAHEWFRGWPGEAAPSHVAAWARDAFNGIAPDMGDRLAASADAGDVMALLLVDEDRKGRARVIPAGGIALLYLAESACRMDTGPFHLAPISVDKPAVRAMTALVGAHPNRHERGTHEVRPDDDDRPTRLYFTWEDGTEAQLELGLYENMGPLEAVGRRYGRASVRDLLTLYFCTFAARQPAGEVFWWWMDEHLELAKLPDTKDNRARLRGWLERMSRTKLVAHYEAGKPLTGPLVTVALDDGDAFKLHLHPALFRGVETELGLGTYWWPTPRSLLAQPADGSAGEVHLLAPVLGQLWRADLPRRRDGGPVAKIGADRLAQRLGINRRKDRNRDTEAARKLRLTLEAGKDAGLVGEWRIEGGDLETGTGTIYATPGAASLAVVSQKPASLPRPPWLPSTGAELRAWLVQKGLPSAEAGDLLGVSASTLRNWTSRGTRPLPKKARAALRAAVWLDL